MQNTFLTELLSAVNGSISTSTLGPVYSSAVGRFLRLLNVLFKMRKFPQYVKKALLKHNALDSQYASLGLYNTQTYKQPEAGQHDQSTLTYVKNYFMKDFGFEIKVEKEWEKAVNIISEEQVGLASSFIDSCMRLGEVTAKFDACYLLQSAYMADDELVAFSSSGISHDLLKAKRNVVEFARETETLSSYANLPESKKGKRDETFKKHVGKLLEGTEGRGGFLLHQLQAKATYSTQIVSGMIFSPSHFPRLNAGMPRADSGGSFGFDESDEFSIGLPPPPPGGLSASQNDAQVEEMNVDWFYDLVSSGNSSTSSENAVSPFHPDDFGESNPTCSLDATTALDLTLKMLSSALDDLDQSLNSFNAHVFERALPAVCSKKDSSNFTRELAEVLFSMDYGNDQTGGNAGSSASRAIVVSGGKDPIAATKALQRDDVRRDSVFTCSHVVDASSIRGCQEVMRSCFSKMNNGTDDYFKQCQVRRGED